MRRIRGLEGRRVLVAVAGAPGSGKSTLAAALVARLADAVLVPMDGFHLDDRLLAARGLLARKGAVETFDAEGFAALAGRLAQPGREVVFPLFDRAREIAIAGAGVVEPAHRIVVVEGNYLLLDAAPWNGVRYDLAIALRVPEAELRRRLEARWQGLGKDAGAVRAHLANDLANARRVAEGSRAADLALVVEEAHQPEREA
ncbi:nucleoside/nucleotide kinase family protein [Paracoccus siganidrum]|uniref:Nucleoside/nucleotide kinase family protein n=1 Tax=Paracoccus siganidrum TaxID=1276757 RepID=A0A418ZR83_9RHOB|nr:AAA family ATPase [Paracoccus siganidrum]RJK98556.1 nucleoside/nucleotide kinase family protein [Paracoccus siganidrum]RMC28466.1 nucleoside/nucleotide kinase family protein [Paracoccus siganidrum]